jgi:hypothetical protein
VFALARNCTTGLIGRMWRSLTKVSSTLVTRLASTTSTSTILPPTLRAILTAEADSVVTARGWVRTLRKQKSVAFLALADGTTSSPVQVVLSPSLCENLGTGACVEVTGLLTNSQGQGQALEIQASSLNVPDIVTLLGNGVATPASLDTNSRHCDPCRCWENLQILILSRRSTTGATHFWGFPLDFFENFACGDLVSWFVCVVSNIFEKSCT